MQAPLPPDTTAPPFPAPTAPTPPQAQAPRPAQTKYHNAGHYSEVYTELVKLEAEYSRIKTISQRRHDLAVQWRVDPGQQGARYTAIFTIPRQDTDMRLILGDEVFLTLPSNQSNWVGYGSIKRIENRTDFYMELHSRDHDFDGPSVPIRIQRGYTLERLFNGVTFDRMNRALDEFASGHDDMSDNTRRILLGHEVQARQLHLPSALDLSASAPNLPPLNYSQQQAVESAMKHSFSLIQGPPGTGKTVTCANIVYHMVQMHRLAAAAPTPSRPRPCVLVAAPSNAAVDHLTAKMHASGVRVIRVVARSRESLPSPVESLTLHAMIDRSTLPGELGVQIAHYRKLEAQGALTKADKYKYDRVKDQLAASLLATAEVVSVTCSSAADYRVQNMSFSRVLIDEATQSCEPETLIPLLHGSSQIVLVGDQCQLGPTITNPIAARLGLNQSLFDRLLLLGLRPIRLTIQYRMHPILAEFSNKTFYDGVLQNGVSAADRTAPRAVFPWFVPDKPMMFHALLGNEERFDRSATYFNRTEADGVLAIVSHLLQQGVTPSQIGVVTPYEGQRVHIEAVFEQASISPDVEVANIDAFQGREKDYIILSCVRSNEKQTIGFLSDPRRLNVALTRAKFGLMIVGNPRVLARHPLWHALLMHFREQGCLVEGTLSNLRRYTMEFGAPDPKFQEAEEKALHRLIDGGALVPIKTDRGDVILAAMARGRVLQLEGMRGRGGGGGGGGGVRGGGGGGGDGRGGGGGGGGGRGGGGRRHRGPRNLQQNPQQPRQPRPPISREGVGAPVHHVTQRYAAVELAQQAAAIYALIDQYRNTYKNQCKIILCLATAKQTQYYASLLKAAQCINVFAVHKLKRNKARLTEQFIHAQQGILCMTSSNAEGVCFKTVQLVIQLGMSSDKQRYLNRYRRTTGASRVDGVLILDPFEAPFLRQLADQPIDAMAIPVRTSDQLAMARAMPLVQRVTTDNAYEAWLKHYTNAPKLHLNQAALVQHAARYAAALGCVEVPIIRARTAENLRLLHVPGLRVQEVSESEEEEDHVDSIHGDVMEEEEEFVMVGEEELMMAREEELMMARQEEFVMAREEELAMEEEEELMMAREDLVMAREYLVMEEEEEEDLVTDTRTASWRVALG